MRTITPINEHITFEPERIKTYIREVIGVQDEQYENKVINALSHRESVTQNSIFDVLIKTALENVDEAGVNWTFIASKIYMNKLYAKASKNRNYNAEQLYGDFYKLLNILNEKGVYSNKLLEKYTQDEIKEISKLIDADKDKLLTYTGAYTIATRYLASGHDKETFELPQERWLVIAMYIMQNEPKEKRLEYIKEAYWALSNLYATVATPTMANSGKTHGQLSSCFVDTVDDTIEGIYNNNADVARLSKSGGGLGVYMGKVRAKGSDIRNYKGVSSGVVPWIKQLNNTAVSVDQLGTRKGAIAIYLDVWHKDILAFLDLKLNNGDERQRAHDIFTGVTLPDIFMETVEARGDWYLFDPHEIKKVMGYALEDCYDEEEGNGTFRTRYMECVNEPKLSKVKIAAIDIMKRIMRSQLETGTPFMFYRDEANRMNANKHEGMIYCPNLCTEITQNMSPTGFLEEVMDYDTGIINKKFKAGDFVVCNLASINLGKAVPEGILKRLIRILVRMLDNVIDINNIEVTQAQRTNQRYRGIGLGTFGWHHLLAKKGIYWESDEAVDYADSLYEDIAYYAIEASMELAKKKGAYPLFKGSEWHTGEYFERRNYTDDRWTKLKNDVAKYGIRNGYIMAVAPNTSTSVVANSTASIDPIFKPFYYDEKKDHKLPIVAPELDHRNYEFYRHSAYKVNQFWSIKQNAKRQRHIDQSISFNLYVPNTIHASILLDLHMTAWKSKLKTTYYVRSTSSELDDCVWCQ